MSAAERRWNWDDWLKIARPEQLPPPDPWAEWSMQGGRGWGKTRAAIEYIGAQLDKPNYGILILAEHPVLLRHAVEGIIDYCQRPTTVEVTPRVRADLGNGCFLNGFHMEMTRDRLESSFLGLQPALIWIEEVQRYGEKWAGIAPAIDLMTARGARLIVTKS